MQWDSIPNIERVCPWWIEPLGSPKIMLKGISILPLPNKTDAPNSSLLGLNNFVNEGQLLSIHFFTFRCFYINFMFLLICCVYYNHCADWILLLLSDIVWSSSKPEYHKVDMDLEGQQNNTGNDNKSIFSIFAFFICLCFFIFVIFVFRPLL